MVYWIPSLSQVGGVTLVRVNHPVKNASKHGGPGAGAFFESLFQRLAPLESKNFATLLPGSDGMVMAMG